MESVKSRLTAYRKERQNEVVHRKEEVSPPPPKETNHTPTAVNHPCLNSWYTFILKIILWFLLWGFFIEVEFGLVYLTASGLVFMVLSLRGRRRVVPGELSAYSVFNKNCESIDGTLSAEQFEKELRYGPTSVK